MKRYRKFFTAFITMALFLFIVTTSLQPENSTLALLTDKSKLCVNGFTYVGPSEISEESKTSDTSEESKTSDTSEESKTSDTSEESVISEPESSGAEDSDNEKSEIPEISVVSEISEESPSVPVSEVSEVSQSSGYHGDEESEYSRPAKDDNPDDSGEDPATGESNMIWIVMFNILAGLVITLLIKARKESRR